MEEKEQALRVETAGNRPTAATQSGAVYSETISSFVFPQLPPAIQFAQSGTVVELRSRLLIHFDAINVSSTVIESVTFPPLSALVYFDAITKINLDINKQYIKFLSKSLTCLQLTPLRLTPRNGWVSTEIVEQRDIYDTNPTKTGYNNKIFSMLR